MIEVFLSPFLPENEKCHASDLIKQIYPNAKFAPKLTSEVSFRIVNPKDIFYMTKMNCLTLTILCLRQIIEKNILIDDLKLEWKVYCNLFLYQKKIAFYKLEEKQVKRYSTMVKCMGGIIVENFDPKEVDYIITKESNNTTLTLAVLPSWIETLFYETRYVKPFHFYTKETISNKENNLQLSNPNLEQNIQQKPKRRHMKAHRISKFSLINSRKNNLKTPVNEIKTIRGDNAGFILRKRDNSQDIRSFMNNPLIEMSNNGNNINDNTNMNNNNDINDNANNIDIDHTNNISNTFTLNNITVNNNNTNNYIEKTCNITNNIINKNDVTNNITIFTTNTIINNNNINTNQNTLIQTNNAITNDKNDVITDNKNDQSIDNASNQEVHIGPITLSPIAQNSKDSLPENNNYNDDEEDTDDVIIISKEDFLNNIDTNKKARMNSINNPNQSIPIKINHNIINFNQNGKEINRPKSSDDNLRTNTLTPKMLSSETVNKRKDFETSPIKERRPLSIKTDLNTMPNKSGLVSKITTHRNTNIFKKNETNKTLSFLSSSSSLDEDEMKILEENFKSHENKNNYDNQLFNAIQNINSFSKSNESSNNASIENVNNKIADYADSDLDQFSQCSQQLQSQKPFIGYEQTETIIATENFSSNDPFLSILSNF